MGVGRLVVLALPTTHDVHSPLRKQFGANISVRVLCKESMVELSDSGVERLTKEIRYRVGDIISANKGIEQVDLLMTGLPLANMIACLSFIELLVAVNFLVYDTRKRRYYRADCKSMMEIISAPRWSG